MNIQEYEDAIQFFDESLVKIKPWAEPRKDGVQSDFIDSNKRIYDSLVSTRESFQKTLDSYRKHLCLECGVTHPPSLFREYCDPCDAKLEAEYARLGIS